MDKEKYDDGTKIILKKMFKKLFSWIMLNNSKNIVREWMSPPFQLLSTILYIYFLGNWGALKINNY
jgi:hypothetical protein